jgi:hypothetical protein
MMNRDLLRAGIREWRKCTVEVEGKTLPASIPFLRGALATTTDPLAHDELLGSLGDEYFRAGFEDELLRVQRERVAQHPESAVVWLSLASSLSVRTEGADEARRAVAKGVEVARQSDALIRYALKCQADVARKTNDSALFEQTVRELIADAPNHREDDCGLDDQVLADLPAGFCSPELEIEYRRLLAEKT